MAKSIIPVELVIPKSSPPNSKPNLDNFYERTRKTVGTFRYLPLIFGEGNLKGNVIWISPERTKHSYNNMGTSYNLTVYAVELLLCEMMKKFGGDKGGYFIEGLAGEMTWNVPGGGTNYVNYEGYETEDYHLIHHYAESVYTGATPWQWFVEQAVYSYLRSTGAVSVQCFDENNPDHSEAVAGMGRYIGGKRSNANSVSAARYNEMEFRTEVLPGIMSYWKNRYLSFVDNGEKGYLNSNIGPDASSFPGIFRISTMIAQFIEDENTPPEFTFRVKYCWNKDYHGCFYRIILFALLERAGIDVSGLGSETGTNTIFGITDDYLNGNFYLNIVIDEQRSIKSAIEEIAQRVGVNVYYYDRFYVRNTLPETITPTTTINQDELIDCRIDIQKPTDIPNYYKVLYRTRKNMTSSQKAVTLLNEVFMTRGVTKIKTLDFSNYTDINIAIDQLSRVAKFESWPKHYGTIVTSLKRYNLRPGDVVTLHIPEAMNADIVVELTRRVISNTEIQFDFMQIAPISSYFSEEQVTGYGDEVIPEITEMQLIELRGSSRYLFDPTIIMIPIPSASLLSYFAANPGKYFKIELHSSNSPSGPWSLWQTIRPNDPAHQVMNARGQLKEAITDDGRQRTYTDESIGILIKNMVGNMDDVIGDCRFLLRIGSEFIEAESVEASGSDYLFKAYTRAILGTVQVDHAVDDTVQVFKRYPSLIDNFFGFDTSGNPVSYFEILENPVDDDFYIKPRLVQADNLAISSLDLTPAFHVTWSEIAKVPFAVGQIKAIRTGAIVVFAWTPVSHDPDHNGAGTKRAADSVPGPYTFDGSFFYSTGLGYTEVVNTTVTLTKSGAFNFYLEQRIDGVTGAARMVAVGADDGIYYG